MIGDVPLTPIQCWFFEQEHPHTRALESINAFKSKRKIECEITRGSDIKFTETS